jgi:hypothetical protein
LGQSLRRSDRRLAGEKVYPSDHIDLAKKEEMGGDP